MLDLGRGQLTGLLVVVHPRTAAAVFAALLQADVPDRPAHRSDLVSIIGLLVGESTRNCLPVNMTQR
jgi:hypothetical protein